jgi:hypothetical protein
MPRGVSFLPAVLAFAMQSNLLAVALGSEFLPCSSRAKVAFLSVNPGVDIGRGFQSWNRCGIPVQQSLEMRNARAHPQCRSSRKAWVQHSTLFPVRNSGAAGPETLRHWPRLPWRTGRPGQYLQMVAREASTSANEGSTKITVLVGSEERNMDAMSLRDAVEQSADDCLVTVHIKVLSDVGAKRLDTFLSESISILSRSALSRIVKANNAMLNGKVPKCSAKVRVGDAISVTLPPPPSTDAEPEDIPLQVLLEDDHVILVNKQVAHLCVSQSYMICNEHNWCHDAATCGHEFMRSFWACSQSAP